MNKRLITIERPLRSRSRSIIWRLISTASGLSKWMADEVAEEDGRLLFAWGEPWTVQEKRSATIINKVANESILLHWDDEEDNDANVELCVLRNELTGDYLLHISDSTQEGDEDYLMQIWEQNLDRLHRTTGL